MSKRMLARPCNLDPIKYNFCVVKLGFSFTTQKRRHNELVSKFNIGLKSLLHQGLSEPEFYGDLVYKFKKIRGMTDFSDQFRKIIMCYIRFGYNLNVMRQSACLVINPITVDGCAALFNCTLLDRASDSMMGIDFSCWDRSFRMLLGQPGLN